MKTSLFAGGLFALLAASAAAQAPVNDDCSTPMVLLGPGTYPFDVTFATTGTQGQTAQCSPDAFHNDLWYTYTANREGTVTATTCGLLTPGTGDYDTRIEVFEGAGCPLGLPIECNDDVTCIQLFASRVTWSSQCGHTYTIQLGVNLPSVSIAGSLGISEAGATCAPTAQPYCFGDGTATACPCGNSGAAGHGCASSVEPSGAVLSTGGNSNLAVDTLVLLGSGMPNSSCLYFQGTTQVMFPFGDGLRCAGGTVRRLSTRLNVAGSSQFPAAGDPAVHVQGAVAAPGTRTYQVWYRNAAAFCTSATYNMTNGVLVTWQ